MCFQLHTRLVRRGFWQGWHLLALMTIACCPTALATDSALWGDHGERWTPQSRLPDFSFAGYHRGEKPLPETKAEVSVKDFGAKGDGVADDTAAIQKAIDQSPGKVISVPAGKYKITDVLKITRSGTVLQGAGMNQTIFICPKPLNDIKPNWGATTTGQRTSNYSWSGGMIRVEGAFPSKVLAQVTTAARRGDTSLVLSSVGDMTVGQDIRLLLEDAPDKSLIKHLYAGDSGPVGKLGKVRETFVCRITGIDSAKRTITFDRPLRTDARLEWKPRITDAKSSVEEAGIEEVSFAFPNTPYDGHFTEVGFNAIALVGTRNCWLRNIWVHNSDSGLFDDGVNTTIQGVLITSERKVEKSRQATGHHGITMGGQDSLLTGFEFRTRFMHDITVSRGSAGNVVMKGRGLDLCFDHHKYAPHSNLFVELDLGTGSRMFQSGGGADLGHHCAAWQTFWNIRARQPQTWPKDWCPDMINLIGVQSAGKSLMQPNGKWFEAINPQLLRPANLYEAQLARRLGRK